MTIFQILALVICSPIGLWSLTNLLDIYIRKNGRFTTMDAFLIMASITCILAAFLGVKVL